MRLIQNFLSDKKYFLSTFILPKTEKVREDKEGSLESAMYKSIF